MEQQKIQIDSADITLLDNGLIHVYIKIEPEISLEDAEAIAIQRERVSGGVPRCILYTTKSKIVIPSPEVRKFLASPERSKLIIANACVISSLAQKLIANFFVRLNKPVAKTKFFDDEDAATAWLLEQQANLQ